MRFLQRVVPTLLLLLLLPEALRPQSTETPIVRSLGPVADSVSGGRPTVFIRRSAYGEFSHQDAKHLVFFDLLKTFGFYNLSYFNVLSESLAIGGGAQIASGILPVNNDERRSGGFGINAGAKWFWGDNGPEAGHLDPTLHVHFVNYGSENQVVVSLIVDAAYQMNFGWFLCDMKIGGEYYLAPLMPGADPITSEGVFFVGQEEQKLSPHIAFHFGFNW